MLIVRVLAEVIFPEFWPRHHSLADASANGGAGEEGFSAKIPGGALRRHENTGRLCDLSNNISEISPVIAVMTSCPP